MEATGIPLFSYFYCMKRIYYLVGLFVLALLLQSSGCKKDDESGGTNLTLEQIITQGTWQVAAFTEAGTDKTAQYSGNTLRFNGGGTMTVVKNSTSFTGAWNINATARTLGINISTFDVQLMALNADWSVTNASETSVQMQENSTQKLLRIQRQ
jgi:hypothetical protein